MPEPREVELKLELDPLAADRVEQTVSATLGRPSDGSRRLRSTYFDTRKRGLRRRGLSLRVRQDGARRIQTLKEVSASGLLDRSEWEVDTASDAPDADLFTERQARAALHARGRLAPLFETAIDRTTWSVREGGSTIEVAVDRGVVRAATGADPIVEVELELKKGAPRDLFALARRIAEIDGVRIGVRSKSERGFALVDGGAAVPVKAEPVRLRRDMNVEQAFVAIAQSCVKQFRLNETGLTERREPDSLHQARVAIRRLRSALSIFGDVVADAQLDAIKGELKALSGKLGEARNLDVYSSEAVEPRRHGPTLDRGLGAYAERVTDARERAYDAVVDHLRSRAFRVFTVDLMSWIETGPWRSDESTAAARDGQVWDFARHKLRRRRKALREAGRHLDRLDAGGRHRVRIRAKKLRYASEFFAGLLEGRRARKHQARFVARLEALQDSLGALNDIRIKSDVAEHLASESVGQDGKVPFAAGRITGEAEEHAPDLLLAACAAHRRFRDAKPF